VVRLAHAPMVAGVSTGDPAVVGQDAREVIVINRVDVHQRHAG
jgi:hypothetical protein